MSDTDPSAPVPVIVPSFDEFIWSVITALRSMGGSATNEELLAKIIEQEKLSPEVQAFLHSDNRQTKVNYNVSWAKTYLKKVGALLNSGRGVWSLTTYGEQLTQADALKVPGIVRRQAADNKKARDLTTPGSNPAAPIDAEEVEATEAPWKDKLLQTLRGLKPDAFERLAQRVLREAGFLKVEVTGRSGDGGIDGIGVLRVNLLSFQVLFQCKRYQGSVGSSAIRDFRGAMVGRSDKGLMITTGTFTPDAKREATRDGAPAIELIEGDDLCNLLKQLKLGVRTELVEKMTIETEWFTDI
jgi:restriction system protein